MRDFVQRRREAAAGRIAHQRAMRRPPPRPWRRPVRAAPRESERIRRLEVEVFALRHHRDAVIADRAGQQHLVAGRALSADRTSPRGTTPTPVVEMNTPSALPRSTTLVSPVTIGTPAAREASPMLCGDALQIGERESPPR